MYCLSNNGRDHLTHPYDIMQIKQAFPPEREKERQTDRDREREKRGILTNKVMIGGYLFSESCIIKYAREPQ